MRTRGKKAAITRIILIATTICAIVALFSACNQEITEIKVKGDAVIKPGETADLYDYLEIQGKGKLSFSLENADVISINGSKIKGLKEGNALVYASWGEFTVRIAVTVSEGRTVKVVFDDVTAIYDGEKHFGAPNGAIPRGTTIEYTCNGQPFYGAIDAGTYDLTANVILPEGYILKCEKSTFRLTVEKAHYKMSGVGFVNRVLEYNGEEQAVFVGGVLPEGIKVTYTGNKATEVGEYYAIAKFEGNNPNYEKIEEIKCKYSIVPKSVSLEEKGLFNADIYYDGKEHKFAVTDLPEGAEAEYYLFDGKNYNKITAPSYIDVGTYDYYCRIKAEPKIAKNYSFFTGGYDAVRAEFTEKDGKCYSQYFKVSVRIRKADIGNGKLILVYNDGKTKTEVNQADYGKKIYFGDAEKEGYAIKLVGGAPEGVKGEFANKYSIEYTINDQKVDWDGFTNKYGFVNSGYYKITANYVLPNGYEKNYNSPKTQVFDLKINKGSITVSEMEIEVKNENENAFDGEKREYSLKGADESKFNVVGMLKKDGKNAESILHAGEYEIRFSLSLKEDSDNYAKIPDVVKRYTLKPQEIVLNGITFDDAKKTYDKQPVKPEIKTETPLDTSVNVEYSVNAITDVGKYTVEAKFTYTKENSEPSDYGFVINGKKTDVLIAIVEIIKASVEKEDFENAEKTVKETTYFYGMKLKDVEFNNSYVKWVNPDDEVKEFSPISENEEYGTICEKAVYNPDEKNYYGYAFNAEAKIKKAELNVEGTTIPHQFVEETDGKVYVEFSGDKYTNEIVTVVKEKPWNYAEITLKAEKPNNYIIKGKTVFDGVKIFRYDGKKFDYKIGSTVLKSIVVEEAEEISVPYGTTETASRILEGKNIKSVVLPNDIKLVKNIFYGAKALRQIELQTMGTDSINGSLAELFGSGKPNEGIKVIVRNDEEIADRKFVGADFVEEVKFVKKVINIGKEAFSGCSALKFLDCDFSAIEKIGEYAFSGCVALQKLSLPYLMGNEGQSVNINYYFGTKLNEYALKEVELTSEKEYVLVKNAFADMVKLEKITFSRGLTAVGESAFKNLGISPDLSATSVTEIGNYAFAYFKGETVTLPDGAKRIGMGAFYEVTNLKRLVLPSALNEIGMEAFYNCKAEIVFTGNNYDAVGNKAFFGYGGKEIALPSSVTSIGEKAFENSALESFIVRENVEVIGEFAFAGCENLTSIVISASVKEIKKNAFYNSVRLTNVQFNGANPPEKAGNGAFNTKGAVINVYVKAGLDNNAFIEYMKNCGAEGHFVLSNTP